MKRFSILAGVLAVLATGLMANKCGDVTFNEPKGKDVPQTEAPVEKPAPAPAE